MDALQIEKAIVGTIGSAIGSGLRTIWQFFLLLNSLIYPSLKKSVIDNMFLL